MYIGLHVKYPLFLSDFNETRVFSTDYRKNTQIPNFVKIRPVGAKLPHAGGRTDRQTQIHDELKSLFTILRTRLTFGRHLNHEHPNTGHPLL